MRSRGTRRQLIWVTAVVALVGIPTMRAQDAGDGPQGIVPLEVEIVVSRYRGDEVVSRAPYTLAVNAAAGDERVAPAQLRIGSDVPVRTEGPSSSFSYRYVGITIECSARVRSDGRYALSVSIEEASVLATGQGSEQVIVDGRPVFRSYSSRNTLLLRNGQSREYIGATDRVSGEVTRIEATLRVVD